MLIHEGWDLESGRKVASCVFYEKMMESPHLEDANAVLKKKIYFVANEQRTDMTQSNCLK